LLHPLHPPPPLDPPLIYQRAGGNSASSRGNEEGEARFPKVLVLKYVSINNDNYFYNFLSAHSLGAEVTCLEKVQLVRGKAT
jgi:hypothetical protein